MNRILACAATTLLATFTATSWAGTPLVCVAMPKAQLGQGNNSPTDVSEPVRATLNKYMAGPSVQLMPLDARIAIQIEAEAAQKSCNYVLQTSVTQTKKTSSRGFFKALAPLAGALPMLGAAGGNMGGMGGMMAGQVASSMATAQATASAENMQQDYMAAMTGAQQSNVKAGDTLTVEYQLSPVGSVGTGKALALQAKAKQDGEDVIGPLLEQVATAVLTTVTQTT